MSRFWVVWQDGGGAPTYKHDTEESAKAEAKRLSAQSPGKTFHVLEQRSAELTQKPDMTPGALVHRLREADGMDRRWLDAKVEDLDIEVQTRLSALSDVCIEMGEVNEQGRAAGQWKYRKPRDHEWVRKNIDAYVKAYEGGAAFMEWLDARWRATSNQDRSVALIESKAKFEELTGIVDTTIPF